MVLSKPDLIEHVASGRLGFDPPIAPDQIAQVSIDLRLGRKFVRPRRGEAPKYLSAVHVHPSLWGSDDLWEQDQDVFRLAPGELVLAQTLERIRIPPDLVGFVEGRSSFARAVGRLPVDLRAAVDAPAQLLLMRVSTPLAPGDLYGTRPGDTFQNQTDPIPRRPRS